MEITYESGEVVNVPLGAVLRADDPIIRAKIFTSETKIFGYDEMIQYKEAEVRPRLTKDGKIMRVLGFSGRQMDV